MSYKTHRANKRGLTKNDWLTSHHSFSFADYYNSKRMGAGKLRVLNDDTLLPEQGFNNHPHSNMEIISLPLSGELLHKDHLGNKHVIAAGDVQIMSAGRRVIHSEFNHSSKQKVNFLQIWVLPKKLDIDARYEQKTYAQNKIINRFHPIVSSLIDDEDAVWINQDAILSLAQLDADVTTDYHTIFDLPIVYFFVISGEVTIQDETLQSRDAMYINHTQHIKVKAKKNSQILCVETVP